VASAGDDWLAGGRVGRPHGLDGSFHVVGPRPGLLVLGAIVRVGSRDAEIVRRAGTDEHPILRLEGFDGRDAAEALRGSELMLPRSAAPSLGEDEWWAEDLKNCRVVDGERTLGWVTRMIALPSCEALEVSAGGEEFLVPLVSDAVRSVDIGAKVIDVDLAFLGETAPAFAHAPDDAGAEIDRADRPGSPAPADGTT
jgi:16S rRNA processing protein RimM